jgi:hypothetical protein
MWDSTMYDFLNKDEMKVLDSMASSFEKHKLEYIFVTEMEEEASESFLKRNYDQYKNVKMLYRMDDFISGLYSIKDIKIYKPKYDGHGIGELNKNELDVLKFKQKPFYLIMDTTGKVIYTNQNKCMILKDTAFLNRINKLTTNGDFKILD